MSERDQEVNLRQRLSGLSRLPLLRGLVLDSRTEILLARFAHAHGRTRQDQAQTENDRERLAVNGMFVHGDLRLN